MLLAISRVALSAVVIAGAIAARIGGAQSPPLVVASPNACSGLRGLRLPDVRLTEVIDVPDSLEHGDKVRAPHCRVAGVIGKEIAFTAMFPNQWNQRLLMGGNGGFAGTINKDVLRHASDGYLTVSTNTGHDEPNGVVARWALDQLERQVNYGFLAVHRTVEVTKVLARAFYGAEPHYAYFDGCSNGGRQGLIEVQRYPEDFDGVISGAPAAHFSTIGLSFLKNVRAAFPTPTYFTHPIVTRANLDLLAAKVLEACDALDGVRDGILADPRDCRFRLASLRTCAGKRVAQDCLTTAQRSVIARVYAPTTDAKGHAIYPGQPFGGENLAGGWYDWILGSDSALLHDAQGPSLAAAFLTQAAKYIVFSDSTWDYSKDRGALATEARRLASLGDAVDPNLARFATHKGKLILYHGWSDPAINPLATVDYYEKVLAADPRAREYVRLFLLPGVLHCGGGPGPASVEWLRIIIDWVENDRAPEQTVATKRDSAGKVIRTRTLCAYPKRAAYVGHGNTDDADNFVCRDP